VITKSADTMKLQRVFSFFSAEQQYID